MTRLAAFMREHNITDVRLATRAGLTPERVGALRHGKSEPRVSTMQGVARAARDLLRRPVRITELFDLGDGER